MNTNVIQIDTATRTVVAAAVVYDRARHRSTYTLAAQAALRMLHAWGDVSAAAAFRDLGRAAAATLGYGGAS